MERRGIRQGTGLSLVVRSRLMAAALLLVLVASCAPTPAPIPTAVSSPTAPTPIAHAPAISFALIGSVTNTNVWALFDSKGYSYNNYAVEYAYWPRLYDLSIPDRQFEAQTASGPPSAITPEGDFYTGTVPLRADLTWSDGSAFTAEDVAFTVNTVLTFQLGYDWHDAYNPDWLDHAETVDAHTVKYYFKKPPNAGVWQYGTLQGVIVQKQYWLPRIAAAVALLPGRDLTSQIEALKSKVEVLRTQVDALNTVSGTTNPLLTRQTQASLTRQQGNLDQATNDLSNAETKLDNAMNAGREALYVLYDGNEPSLGSWTYESSQKGVIQNQANSKFPLEHPKFDRAVYRFYSTGSAAMTALLDGEVDMILAPNDLPAGSAGNEGNPATQNSMTSPTHSLAFIVFNPLTDTLRDPALHQALACLLEPEALAGQLQGKAVALESYVVPHEADWCNANAVPPCKGLDSASRLTSAVQILKSAGYTWKQEPSAQTTGKGLTAPSGTVLRSVTLLAPASDEVRVAAASYAQQQARLLGIPLTAESASSEQINYAVFSSHRYDMAILAWNVSEYPGYLCDWFGVGNPFEYDVAVLKSICATLQTTSDLDSAHRQIFDMQSILAKNLPFIPLYSDVTAESYRRIRYPFKEVLDGLSSVYGAPSLAIPLSP